MDRALAAQLPFTLKDTDFPALGQKYRGKVRDTYRRDDRLVLITTDRISAFDHILTTLPFKGDLLNQLAHFWFQKTSHVIANHVLDMPDPCVTVAKRAEPYAVEFVVRGYLTGSLWRDYEAGKDPYAIALPKGLKRDQKFEKPILTPSTKAEIGQHDEPVSIDEVVRRGLMTRAQWDEAAEAALGLFSVGQQQAAARGLIFVDTKYEFGRVGGKLTLIDEIHTPDSSRFWVAEGSTERFAKGQSQKMLDKENLRQWLITERGFSGQGQPPPIPDDVRVMVAKIYLAAFEQLTGTTFNAQTGDVTERLTGNLKRAGLI